MYVVVVVVVAAPLGRQNSNYSKICEQKASLGASPLFLLLNILYFGIQYYSVTVQQENVFKSYVDHTNSFGLNLALKLE